MFQFKREQYVSVVDNKEDVTVILYNQNKDEESVCAATASLDANQEGE